MTNSFVLPNRIMPRSFRRRDEVNIYLIDWWEDEEEEEGRRCWWMCKWEGGSGVNFTGDGLNLLAS